MPPLRESPLLAIVLFGSVGQRLSPPALTERLMSPSPVGLVSRVDALIAHALATYPEITVEEPWGFPVVKVRGKILVMLSIDGDTLHVTLKLRDSHADAMDRPNVSPASHGLGKSGWITAAINSQWPIDEPQLHAWINEAFHLVAPKKLRG